VFDDLHRAATLGAIISFREPPVEEVCGSVPHGDRAERIASAARCTRPFRVLIHPEKSRAAFVVAPWSRPSPRGRAEAHRSTPTLSNKGSWKRRRCYPSLCTSPLEGTDRAAACDPVWQTVKAVRHHDSGLR